MQQAASMDRLIIVLGRTVLGFVIFFVMLFVVPIYNEFKDNNFVLALVSQKDAVIGETAIKIEIADSKKERITGLSGKPYLEDYTGLLFIFDEPDFHGIWMKDMNFPIDIVWLDSSLQIIDFKENASPSSYPETYKPNKKALYVLEVPKNFISQNYLKIGDQMTIL
jgi:uncharacterized membrane protein (UPF0127 family)